MTGNSSRLKREAKKGQLVLFGLIEEGTTPPASETLPSNPASKAAAPVQLPDLDAMFRDLNERFFEGLLGAKVDWSNRLSAASGKCDVRRRIIRISVKHYTKRPLLLEATLAHEMLHLIVPDHGKEFRRLGIWIAGQLGVPYEEFRYAENWADLRRFKYLYACPSCNAELVSRKRRSVSCGRCGGGRFDERFRMVLTESRARPGPVLLGERPVRSR